MSRLLFLTLAIFVLAAPAPASTGATVSVVRHAYKTTERRSLELICHLPADWRPSDHRPAVVFYYGGGFWTWNVEQFAQQADYFARRGLVAILADYRTGEKDGTKPPAAFEDARSALRWLRSHARKLGVDPDRIAASGGSAGGSLAASLVINDGLDALGDDLSIRVRPDALLLYNPGLSSTVNDRTIQRYGSETVWRKTAAMLHTSGRTPPTLLLYGSQDNLLNGGRAYAAQLQALGVRADIHITDGVGHGFFNFTPHLAETTRLVDAFLQSLGWLKPEPIVPLPVSSAKLSESPNNPERGK